MSFTPAARWSTTPVTTTTPATRALIPAFTLMTATTGWTEIMSPTTTVSASMWLILMITTLSSATTRKTTSPSTIIFPPAPTRPPRSRLPSHQSLGQYQLLTTDRFEYESSASVPDQSHAGFILHPSAFSLGSRRDHD